MWEWVGYEGVGSSHRLRFGLTGTVMSVTKVGKSERGLDWKVGRED